MRDIPDKSSTVADRDRIPDPRELGRWHAREARRASGGLRRLVGDPLKAYLRAYGNESRLLPGIVRPGLWRASPGRMVPALTMLVASIVFASGTWLVLNWSKIATLVDLAEQQLACTEVVAFEASEGSIAGVVPVRGDSECRDERRALIADDGPARPFLTVPVADALHEPFANMIASIEGRYRRAETVCGQDLTGVPRYLYGKLVGSPRGFSGPLLSAFESLVGYPNGQGFSNKLRLIAASCLFTRRHLDTDSARARFLVESMPSVVGLGYPLAGRLGMEAIFDRAPDSLAARCIYARASGFPLRLGDVSEPPSEMVVLRWTKALGPATARCIREQARTPGEAEAALATIRRLCDGSGACLAPRDPAGRLHRESAARKFLPQPGPKISRGARRLLLAGLRRAGEIQPGRPAVLQTGLSRRAQIRLDLLVSAAVAQALSSLPNGSCLDDHCPNPVRMTMAAIELTTEGPVLRSGWASHSGAFFGPVTSLGDRFEPRAPDFGLASLNKVLLALVATRHGYTQLCSGGADDFCTGGTWVALGDAMARSDTGAFAWLAERHIAEVAALMDVMGYSISARPLTGRNAAMGTGRLPTAAGLTAFLAALTGDGLIFGVQVGDAPALPADLRDLGYSKKDLRGTLELLGAPLGSGGTLNAMLARIARPKGCSAVAGKSGTHSVKSRNIVKTSLVLWSCSGRSLITFAEFSTGDAERSLGPIRHADLAPLHTALLESFN